MSELEINKKRIKRCSRELVRIQVTEDLCGSVDIFAHILTGKEEGPTLLLLSMLHGNEWFSVLILRELLKILAPNVLKGNIIAVPVVNPVAMLTETRCIQDDSDEPDANRAFGGTFHWLTNQITNVIDTHLMSVSDYLIDYHVSDWGSTMADVTYKYGFPNPEIDEKSKGMARAYGFPILHVMEVSQSFTGTRSSLAYAGIKYNIPGIVAEIGGLGFGEDIERQWLQANINGTLSVMRYLGMLDGSPTYCDRYLIANDRWRLSPKKGGYLEPVVGLERQFTEVEKGELLARVISPTTFEVVDELRSPGKGVIFYACRSYMARPGSWAFGIANLENGTSYWTE